MNIRKPLNHAYGLASAIGRAGSANAINSPRNWSIYRNAILDNRTPEPGGAEGLADVRIIEAMHRSIKSGHWVDVALPPQGRRTTAGRNIRRPPVSREPNLVHVRSASR